MTFVTGVRLYISEKWGMLVCRDLHYMKIVFRMLQVINQPFG